MSEKVTAYDLSYLQGNPFEDITAQTLLNNLEKVEINSTNSDINYDDQYEKKNNQNNKGFFSRISNMFMRKEINPYESELQRMYRKQAEAITYQDWLEASTQLDILEDKNSWKDITESDLYDYELVRSQLEEMRRCRINHDYDRILYIIRTSWKRDFAGINNELLYKQSHVGTKTLISDYIEECVNCLASLVSENCLIDDEYILDVLLESKRNYGRAGITMSGGGTFGLIGIGVFSTLLEMDLFPKIVSGSSCGSIVSSIMCSKKSEEIKEILSSLFDKTFEVFNVEDDNDTLYTHLSRLLKFGVWFDSKYLQQTMKGFLGNITFKEAFNKTGRILNITVSSATIHDQPTLLNYLTAPNVLIWSAVCASCSLPVVFASSTIYEKNSETGEITEWSNPMLKFVDGSLNSDLPISRLSEMFNVNHTIACQVNPHILPLVKLSTECNDSNNNGSIWNFKRMVYNISSILTLELSHYCEVLNELGIMGNLATKLRQLMSQSYLGDITILPEIRLGEQLKTLTNPSPTFIWNCMLEGARATWPKLSIIKDQYSVEFAIDKYISVLRSRVVFDSMKKSKGTPFPYNYYPQKNFLAGMTTPPKTMPLINFNDYRKRGETITLSEKLRRDENISPRSSRINLYAKSRKPKKNIKFEVSVLNYREDSPLRPDHSFESLRYMQKRLSFENQVNNSNKRHVRSLSYTQIPETNRRLLKDNSAEHSCQEEIIYPITDNKRDRRRSSASSAIQFEDEETIPVPTTNAEGHNDVGLVIYPGELKKVKSKNE